VPVCGGILLDSACEHCVLVKGWKSGASWGFPKGKINDEEERWGCAVREVSRG
jgi:mRNA-decapping enzyme subunit 2